MTIGSKGKTLERPKVRMLVLIISPPNFHSFDVRLTRSKIIRTKNNSKTSMARKSKKDGESEQITTDEALKLYRSTLNFNVISRYDPFIKQLLCHTSHCVLYKFNEEQEEWIKSDYQGTLALYLRNYTAPANGVQTYQDLQNLYCYGLILLNRNNPTCFSLGLLPNKITKHFLPLGVHFADLEGNRPSSEILEMDIELNDNLIIVKNLFGEIYGLWVFNEEDRKMLYKSIEFCINTEQ